jgi:hypothetical protein
MAKRPPGPIPTYLREAFADALELFPDWSAALPEREVSIKGKPFTMSAVCSLVDGYNDRLPDSVVAVLTSHVQVAFADLTEQLTGDPSYTIGAKCLRRLIANRKADYQRVERRRP